jgi:DNA (cytosine-5)-methyltransferase 1
MACLGYRAASDFVHLKEIQGLPADFDLPSFTVSAKCKAVGNGVPLPMGRAIARAVREAIAVPERKVST